MEMWMMVAAGAALLALAQARGLKVEGQKVWASEAELAGLYAAWRGRRASRQAMNS
jgi:hypothetical protein